MKAHNKAIKLDDFCEHFFYKLIFIFSLNSSIETGMDNIYIKTHFTSIVL